MNRSKITVVALLTLLGFGCGGVTAGVGGVDASGNDAAQGGDSASMSDSGGADSASTTDSGGADSSTTKDSGTTTDSGTQIDSSATDTGTDAGSTQCPSTEPAGGAPCPMPGLQCQYGTAPRGNCNPIATCAASGWQISTPDPTCSTPPPMCPSSAPTATQYLAEVHATDGRSRWPNAVPRSIVRPCAGRCRPS